MVKTCYDFVRFLNTYIFFRFPNQGRQMDDLEKGMIQVDNVKEKLVTAFDEKGVVHGIGEEEEALWCASCWNEVL